MHDVVIVAVLSSSHFVSNSLEIVQRSVVVLFARYNFIIQMSIRAAVFSRDTYYDVVYPLFILHLTFSA